MQTVLMETWKKSSIQNDKKSIPLLTKPGKIDIIYRVFRARIFMLFILRFPLILRYFRIYFGLLNLLFNSKLCFVLSEFVFHTIYHAPSTCRPSPQSGSVVRLKAQTHRLVEKERGGGPTALTPTSRRNWDHCARRCGDRQAYAHLILPC